MLIALLESITDLERKELITELVKLNINFMSIGKYKLIFIDNPIDKINYLQQNFKIEKIIYLKSPYKLASREFSKENTIINIRNIKIGGGNLFNVAGPCSIENRKQLEQCAKIISDCGSHGLRGGAFKPRTSPYEYQGIGIDGIYLMAEIAQKYNLLSVSEIMSVEQLELAYEYLDIIQIGARNMQNFDLLKSLGKVNNPILLKRGFGNTYEELLMSAEYIILSGNSNVILCERGIRTFETHNRNTLDLSAVPSLKEITHLPILVDPSHGTGRASIIPAMSLASVAAGADGLLLETHPDPINSVSDAAQALSFDSYRNIMKQVLQVHDVIRKF